MKGGTPTATTLERLAHNPELNDPNRDDFILLVTDGVPNCSASEQDPATCTCSIASSNGVCSPSCNCLDRSVVQTVQSLRARGIRTIVVGFGPDTAVPLAETLLNEMAEAGGMAAACPNGTNAECGVNNACDAATGKCARSYYHASTASELAQVLPQVCEAAASSAR